jgi:hypothetical protein
MRSGKFVKAEEEHGIMDLGGESEGQPGSLRYISSSHRQLFITYPIQYFSICSVYPRDLFQQYY